VANQGASLINCQITKLAQNIMCGDLKKDQEKLKNLHFKVFTVEGGGDFFIHFG